MNRKIIAVVDGQGGGIGSLIIKEIKKSFGESFEIIALGTNAIATMAMLSSGANKGATGESAISYVTSNCDYIVGSISILLTNSMLGELTEKMATSIALSKAKKILVPISQEKIEIVGLKREPLPHLVRELIEKIKDMEEK
ncbi:MAG: DUF3842 family protein [Proteobacteria bacterium]|nr:DUF3842 family protein [Pseudomonadota bacterium]